MSLRIRACPPPARRAGRAARTPAGTVIYAIGDVHGRADLLAQILDAVRADAAQREAPRSVVVFLGDYLSRGPDSPTVVELAMAPKIEGAEIVALRGNHEDLLLRFLDGNLAVGNHWLGFGAAEALVAYGAAAPNAPLADPKELQGVRERLLTVLPAAHLRFFRALQAGRREGDYYFCHAGLRPGVPLERQTERDQVWIRKRFLNCNDDFGVTVVHGHCITPEVDVRHNRIGIDTGAFASGRLTCLVLDAEERLLVQTEPPGSRGP